MIECYSSAVANLDATIASVIQTRLGHLSPQHIVLKPNWVLHETDSRYPCSALVTDARVIVATVMACGNIFPDAKITVCDCPLQRADWVLMCEQSGLTPLMQDVVTLFDGRVSFHDLRQDVMTYDNGRLVSVEGVPHGDPAGYREVRLGSVSHFEDISGEAHLFSIHDHDRRKAQANHQKGDHRYYVSQTILNADLLINLPKWKTHSKSGLTGALKNLVGINGDKAYLPHFRSGPPRWGGDEYTDRGRWLAYLQNSTREYTREKAWWAYRAMQPSWKAFKRLRTGWRRAFGSDVPPDFYVGGGGWYGNETVWRMIYDLNMIVQRMDSHGVLQSTPQRSYFCIVDGIIAGQGDGPLHSTPREVGWLMCGEDPFAIDASLAWLMGYDPSKLQIIARRDRYMGPHWGAFDLNRLEFKLNGVRQRMLDCGINFAFTPPPGWVNHVERFQRTAAR